MRSHSITLLAAALLALAASPAFAFSSFSFDACSSADCGGGAGKAVPGPIAGVGLGYLVLAGGYYVVRRLRKQKAGE